MTDHKPSLDLSIDEFRAQLHKACELVLSTHANMESERAYPCTDEASLRQIFDTPLPRKPEPFEQVLQETENSVFANATKNIAPKMFAYVMSGGNQTSVIADLLASAINQNVAKWHLAPSLTEVERRIFAWTSEWLNLPEHSAGMMVSAGSSANLSGLTIARNVFFAHAGVRENGLCGMKPMTVYASSETHNSVDKSIEFLGLGKKHLRKIPVLENFTINTEALIKQIEADASQGFTPFCIVANAGTVNTGAIDPLDTLADIAQHYGLWLHVDGCYGGLVRALPERKSLYNGIERADTIALDFHKWLYQPFEIGCTLVKDWQKLRHTFLTPASYLNASSHDSERFNFNEHHFALSRNGKALKVWMSLKHYGADAFEAMIRKDIALTEYLKNLIQENSLFESITEGPLGIHCFRYVGQMDPKDTHKLNAFNNELISALEKDGRVFITGTQLNGRSVIRACLINHRLQKSHIEDLLNVIAQIAKSLESKV